jgi:hypothetical protein
METFAIGSILRESLAIALRHWLLIVLSVLALVVACVGNTILLTRCMLSPACVPTALFQAVASNIDAIIWAGNRIATWLVCGLSIQHVLAAEAARTSGPGMQPSKSLAGFGRCVAYLLTLSALTYLTIPLFSLVPHLFASVGTLGVLVSFGLLKLMQVCIWAYADARFALYAAAHVSGGRAEGFLQTWKMMQGNRRRLYLLFVVIEASAQALWLIFADSTWLRTELVPFANDVGERFGMPRDSLAFRMPDIIDYVVFVVVSDLFCTGAFFSVYRRYLSGTPEMRAAVFD